MHELGQLTALPVNRANASGRSTFESAFTGVAGRSVGPIPPDGSLHNHTSTRSVRLRNPYRTRDQSTVTIGSGALTELPLHRQMADLLASSGP